MSISLAGSVSILHLPQTSLEPFQVFIALPMSPAIDTAGKDWEQQRREQQAGLAVRGGTYNFLGKQMMCGEKARTH